MQAVLGVDIATVASVVVGLFVVGLTSIVVAALRNRLLFRLAVRNVPRRPFQSTLIALGLALATIIVTTALTTGDTLSHTVRSLVAGSIGRADEVVVKPRRDPRRNPLESAQAVAQGTFLTGTLEMFEASEADRLAGVLQGVDRIAGIAPAIVDQVVATSTGPEGTTAELRLFGLPREYPPVFGRLTARDGRTMPWADAPRSSVVLNDAAASLLGVGTGDGLALTYRDQILELTVLEVARNGDPGGLQPTAFVPLDDLQRLAGLDGQINQILIANRGDATTSVRLSGEVTRAVRPHLLDDAVTRRVFALLRTDAARAALTSLIPSLEGRDREQLEALQRELDRPEPTPVFKALIADPDVERRLLIAAGRAGGSPAAPGRSLIDAPGALRLVEVKRLSQELADRWGAALTAVFVVLGLFSLATGSILVVLIFVLLAAERRTELGTLRALGATKRHVTAMLLYEGLAYDLIAAGLGLAIGAAVAVGLVFLSAQALSAFGVDLAVHVEPRSLVLAYCLGAVITMASIAGSAWQASRLTIVAAIKDLPEPAARSGTRRSLVTGIILLAAAALASWLSAGTRFALPAGGSIVLALLGLASLLRPVLLRFGMSARVADRTRHSLAGLLLLSYWLIPDDVVARVGWLRPLPRSVDVFFVAGLSLVLGAVLVLASNLQVAAGLVRRVGLRRPGGALLPRLALTFPTQHPRRTGLTVAMFGIVVFSMVVASVLLTATHRAYTDPAALAGGYDIRVDDSTSGTSDFRALLASTPGLAGRDLSAIATVHGYTAEGIQPGGETATWRSVGLSLVDDEFALTVRAGFSGRAKGYADDAAIWRAIREQPGLAVAAGPLVRSRGASPPLGSFLALNGVASEDTSFAPVNVWVRDARSGRPVKLTVIGVIDPRAMLGSGLFTSRATYSGIIQQAPTRTVHYVRVVPDVNPGAVNSALNVALGPQGIRAAELGEDLRRIVGLRSLLNQLLQTFMGVGLLAGVAGLGVLSARAVVERRQQIGVLRALGFTRRAVQAVFLLEASVVALLGIAVGVVLGLGLASRLVAFLSREFPEIMFAVPWWQIGGIAAFAYLAAVAMTTWPAWRAGRIEPSTALRYE
jgi:putative ABC transport system permease protein